MLLLHCFCWFALFGKACLLYASCFFSASDQLSNWGHARGGRRAHKNQFCCRVLEKICGNIYIYTSLIVFSSTNKSQCLKTYFSFIYHSSIFTTWDVDLCGQFQLFILPNMFFPFLHLYSFPVLKHCIRKSHSPESLCSHLFLQTRSLSLCLSRLRQHLPTTLCPCSLLQSVISFIKSCYLSSLQLK